MSKQQKTIPVFLCGRCPVPAPAGSAVDLWQPGKTDSKHHLSQPEDRATWQVSSVERRIIFNVSIFIDFNMILYKYT